MILAIEWGIVTMTVPIVHRKKHLFIREIAIIYGNAILTMMLTIHFVRSL